MAFRIQDGERSLTIGEPDRCFVIAEAGVNHNGDVALAKQLVDAAAAAGADAVKFQTWRTEKLVGPAAPLAEYQRDNTGGAADDQFALLQELELDEAAFTEVAEHARRRGIVFLSTPDEEESADFLERLGVPLFKIGSAEVTNVPFLRHVGAKRRPVILSTGMATLEEVARAVEALQQAPHLVLLQCVSSYPSQPAESNLRAMDTLREAFRHSVGFSDHTVGAEVALAAVARGAAVLEKHLTLDRKLPGPDHALSLEPGAFGDLVRAIRVVESSLGDGVKQPTRSERETMLAVRRRILAARDLAEGTRLAESDLVLRRAGAGLQADQLADAVGRTLARDVSAGEPLEAADLR